MHPRVALYLCGDWYKHTSRKPTDSIMNPQKNHNPILFSPKKKRTIKLHLAQVDRYAKKEEKKVYICLCMPYKCAD